jgi:hypothetical protein
VQEVLLDQATANVLGQVGEQQRRECRPRRDADLALAAAGEVEEQAGRGIQAALEQRALDALRAPRVSIVACQAGHRAQAQRVRDVHPAGNKWCQEVLRRLPASPGSGVRAAGRALSALRAWSRLGK